MFKSVLAHLSGTDADQSVLATALQLVRPFAGHMDCLRVIPDYANIVLQAAQFEVGMTTLLGDTIDSIETQCNERTARARTTMREFFKAKDVMFAESPPTSGPSFAWRETVATDECDEIIRNSRSYDLVVLAGGKERAGHLPAPLLGSIAIHSGRPVVLAPEKIRSGPLSTIAIAWKDAAEPARALTAALPLLKTAHRIEILSANEEDDHAGRCVECSENIVRQLRWHGFDANHHFIVPAGRTPADAILESAGALNADFLVAGAYGHSRTREMVFGGFTRRILEGVELPVLLFH